MAAESDEASSIAPTEWDSVSVSDANSDSEPRDVDTKANDTTASCKAEDLLSEEEVVKSEIGISDSEEMCGWGYASFSSDEALGGPNGSKWLHSQIRAQPQVL